MKGKKLSLLIVLLIASSVCCLAQATGNQRISPLAVISMRFKDAYVKITYSQPRKKGRDIFGKLVPFGQVWRTGANEATEITVTKNIQINGILLLAGTYSIFTIPGADKWTIIINRDVGLWGSYNYSSKADVMRFSVPVQPITGSVYEEFTMQFDQRNEQADLSLMWDRTKVSIPVKFIN